MFALGVIVSFDAPVKVCKPLHKGYIRMPELTSNPLVLRGKNVREDAFGRLCLEDIHELARALPSKLPIQWRARRPVRQLVSELRRKVSLASVANGKPVLAVLNNAQIGAEALTFAHPILAAAYAGFLSPKLEIEVREIWLRYRQGDATLADEVLQRASAEDNKWAGTRALSRAQRNVYTDVLQEHGVADRGYMECTEAVYIELLGGKSYQIRKQRGWSAKANLRDNLDHGELAFVIAAEALAVERIREEGRYGNQACAQASMIGARAIRDAIDRDRQSRSSATAA